MRMLRPAHGIVQAAAPILLAAIIASVGCRPNAVVTTARVSTGSITETFTWNGKTIAIVLAAGQAPSRSRTMSTDSLELTFGQQRVKIEPRRITVNGQPKELKDFSAVVVNLDANGLSVTVDGAPLRSAASQVAHRQFDVELVYREQDGTESTIAIRSPDVAQVLMTVKESPHQLMTCQLELVKSSTVDQYMMTYTIGGTSRGKLVTYAGKQVAINKTQIDTYAGTFYLRPPE